MRQLNKGLPQDALKPVDAGEAEHPLFNFAEPVGLMSGDNPLYPAQAQGGQDALKRDLDSMGVRYNETEGHYGAPERSMIIYGLPKEQLQALGRKYGQEAVIHNQDGQREFIYTNGPNAGTYHPGLPTYDRWSEEEGPPEDYYTKVPGTGYVRLYFDFDDRRSVQADAAAPMPGPVSQPPAPATKHEIAHRLYGVLKKVLVEVERG